MYAIAKSKETCLRKYGVEHVMQNKEMYYKILLNAYKLKTYITSYGTTIYYQSMAELEFVKLCEQNNIFICNGPFINYILGKRRVYVVDFQIETKDGIRLIEIKRKHPWWYQNLKSGMIKAKTNAAIKYSKENGYLPYKILFENKFQ